MTKSISIVSTTLLLLTLVATGCSDQSEVASSDDDRESPNTNEVAHELIVEASCGECQFGLPGDGCDLAVRIDGDAYYVDGSHIDDHGDAHGEGGMCNAIRQAKVVGQVENGRFVATSFELLPLNDEH